MAKPTFSHALLDLMPREHGFWVMLSAVLLTALLEAGISARNLLVFFAVLLSFVLIGGVMRRRIRRHGALQLASSAVLATAGLPIDWLGGMQAREMLARVLCWAAVFMGGALVVRSAFARARRGGAKSARALELCSIALPLGMSLLLSGLSFRPGAISALIAAIGCLVLILRRPTVKQLKPIGIALAAVTTLSGVALLVL